MGAWRLRNGKGIKKKKRLIDVSLVLASPVYGTRAANNFNKEKSNFIQFPHAGVGRVGWEESRRRGAAQERNRGKKKRHALTPPGHDQ